MNCQTVLSKLHFTRPPVKLTNPRLNPAAIPTSIRIKHDAIADR